MLADTLPFPSHVAVRDGYVYWPDALAGTVSRISASGGSVDELAGGFETAVGVAVDNRNAYVTSYGPSMGCTEALGSVVAVSLATGATTVLAAELLCPGQVLVDDTGVYWVNNGAGTAETPGDGSVMRVPKLPL